MLNARTMHRDQESRRKNRRTILLLYASSVLSARFGYRKKKKKRFRRFYISAILLYFFDLRGYNRAPGPRSDDETCFVMIKCFVRKTNNDRRGFVVRY
jgi:hypothetical protein